jgi:predicted transcriptional regulator
MNAKIVNYLKDTYKGRTITGIKENKSKNKNKMKNEALKKLIKEEILSMLEVDAAAAAPTKKAPSEVVNLIKYLQGTGKTPLSQINSPSELKQILDTIFAGMNPAMMKNAGVLSVKKIIDMKL